MLGSLLESIREIFLTRLGILVTVYLLFFGVVFGHFFRLQIVSGEEYQKNYTVRTIKEKNLSSTRGNIYDRNGVVLAYNELAYNITIEDNGTYSSTAEKNETINSAILYVLHTLDRNGDEMDNSFSISLNADGTYSYNVTGTKLQRFLADVYGYSSYDDMGYNKRVGYNTARATADQVMDYLCGEKHFDIGDEYEINDRYRIAIIRYAMSQNGYKKYIETTIATDVSEKSVAAVSEHLNMLQGVEIAEDTIRRYDHAEYFASIIGYTGKISETEYETLSKENDSYAITDVVGKSGIEQYMDSYLKGQKGSERVIVDNLGKEIETLELVEATAGDNIYLSIDAELQKACYDMLEQEIAGIVYSKIVDEKEYESSGSSDIMIPIYDVYFALINNNIISLDHMSGEKAGAYEKKVYGTFSDRLEEELFNLRLELTDKDPDIYSELDEDMAVYELYAVTYLQSIGVFNADAVDVSDETYLAWKNGEIALRTYLEYAINSRWIDVTTLPMDSKYVDSEEIYDVLVSYVINQLRLDSGFAKKIYKYMIRHDLVTGTDLALVLYEQEVIDYDDETIADLKSGRLTCYDFYLEKIKNLEITPAQLALDPCSGSCVITNVKTGELLACVSYPGYDNNRLANTVDAAYYARLANDLSAPFYNNATQEKTAPGSTFKMVTAAAGVTEGVINTDTQIKCDGVFSKVNDGPKCWKYPGSHGIETLSDAIRDSCNVYFYEVGWRLSNGDESYSESTGIEKIRKYATLFGLNEKTGIEINESEPEIADEYPITAAIGQSNHNYTTIGLGRYITAVANEGTVYKYTLIDHITDSDGTLVEKNNPDVLRKITEISDHDWAAIHEGNLGVCQSMSSFKDFFGEESNVRVAGKTGTAQQIKTRPNHALFVGYAPYEDPEMSVAVRIAYGYTSHNTADLAGDIFKYYFKLEDPENLITGQAAYTGTNSNAFGD